MKFRSDSLRSRLLAGIVVACGASSVPDILKPAYAQVAAAGKAKPAAYIEIKMGDAFTDASARREKQQTKSSMLKGTISYNKKEVEDYYKGVIIPQLTSLKHPEDANDARKEMVEDCDRAEKASDSVLNEFNNMIFGYMSTLAEGNFQPSATINATLVIGNLNSSRAKGSAPPVPFRNAQPQLLKLFAAGKNDGIRAAALQGLDRHIELTGGAQEIADLFLAFLRSSKPAQRNLRSDAWMRGRVVEMLLKIKLKKESQTELIQYATKSLANPITNPLLLEKALMVVGSFPATELPPDPSGPMIGNSLQYLLVKAKDWRNEVNEAHAFKEGGGDASEDMADPVESAEVEVGSEEEGMAVRKKKEKPKAAVSSYGKQSNDVKTKRRWMHELLEPIRLGLAGSKFGPLPPEFKSGLAATLAESYASQEMHKFLKAMNELQEALNSSTIADRSGLAAETIPKVDAMISSAEMLQRIIAIQPVEPNVPEPVAPTTPAPAPDSVTVNPTPR
ncbi:MAG: hypothetical protein SGI77_26665 [Pirellulaceae bacterium]|nr:hypothetical protein [Pirellulaceae bacterium]